MRKAVYFLLFLFFFCRPVIAQRQLQYSFTHYAMNNGLSAHYITSTVQDDQGFIWIGTLNGLQRFDGTRFITFYSNQGQPSSIPNNFITWIHFDRRNRLWLAFANGKVGVFDTKRFVFKEAIVKLANPLPYKGMRTFYEDSQGHIICTYLFAEQVTYDESSNTFAAKNNLYPVPEGKKLVNLKEYNKGQKIIYGTDSGLVVYNKKTKNMNYRGHNPDNEKIINQLGTLHAVTLFMVDKSDRIWFQSWPKNSGVPLIYCFNMRSGITEMHSTNLLYLTNAYHEVFGLLQQKDGTIWIHGLGILAKYDEKTKRFLPVNNKLNEKRISFSNVHQLFEDRESNLWISTNNNGIYLFNPSQQLFTSIPHINRVSKQTGTGGIMSFAQLKNGDLLTGTWGDGIYRYNRELDNIPLNIKGLQEANGLSAWSMCRIKNSSLIWMGLQPGILIYDEQTNIAIKYNPAILKNLTVRHLQDDRYGRVWVGTQHDGIFVWDPILGKEKFENGFRHFDAIPSCLISEITTDANGHFWIGTMGFGIYEVDPTTSKILHHYDQNGPENSRLLSESARCILPYDDTTILIASEGLSVLNPQTKTIRHSKHYNQLALEQIAGMVKDAKGNVWISMINGLCVMRPGQNTFTFFDRNDGMLSDIFTDNAGYVLQDGRVAFGSNFDFVVFDPSIASLTSRPPPVVITDMRIQNKSYLIDSLRKLDRIELAPIQNSIEFEFSTLTYLNKYPLIYQLEGIDKEWKKADDIRQVSYNYLPSGNYTFRVKVETEKNAAAPVTEMIFRIKPPFWKTWWFVALIVLAATYIFFWLDKLRMQKIRATESIRSRIATSLTEDMTSSLSSINIASELAKLKVDTDKQRTKEYIGQISDTSNRMVQAMYDMVWSIHPNNDTMKNTLERMKSYALEMEDLHGIDIVFDVDEESAEIDIDMENRYELLAIFKEAILNAVKHSGARYIQVGIRRRGSKFYMLIEDDGKGFDLDVANRGRGINDMRRRAEAIHAIFRIESDINTGTMIKVEMPV